MNENIPTIPAEFVTVTREPTPNADGELVLHIPGHAPRALPMFLLDTCGGPAEAARFARFMGMEEHAQQIEAKMREREAEGAK